MFSKSLWRLLALCVAFAGSSLTNTVGLAQSTSPRQTVSLNQGWRFRFGADAAGVTDTAFDDRDWDKINLPHTWNHLGEYKLTRSEDVNDKQGIGYYRLHFIGPAADATKRNYLQFDSVGNIAEVWLNGVRVGEHKGAFSRFRFDVTTMLKPHSDNVLVVKADNSKPAPGSSTENVIPLGGDFFIFGGIYRGVSLITANVVSIDLLDHGGPGVYAQVTSVTPKSAKIEVRAKVRDFGSVHKNLFYAFVIRDAAGRAVEPMIVKQSKIAADELSAILNVPKPHLWNGRSDPYLYSIEVAISDERASHPLDSVTVPLGIRTFSVDKNQGFTLNGKYIQLVGASRHQDRPGIGWALGPNDAAEDMSIMAEMGANTVRMAHYQHAQEWDDAADKTGMVAWAEIPFVNAVSFKDGEPASPALIANAREQLTELIRQNYNHPSIMMWSVGNEIDIGASFGRGKLPAQSIKLLKELNDLAHQEDPSRPTTFADCCEEPDEFASAARNPVLTGTADLAGYNRYYGWYYGKPADFGPKLDHFHLIHPNTPMSVSEYGAGGALTQHSDNPLGGPINAFGRPHPEEYQSYYHEQTWQALKSRKYLFADWIWNMFDFASDLRGEGDSVDLNDKGLVSYDRKIKKDSFYFYKANLNPEPMIYLTSRRYVDRAFAQMDVRAYSNAMRAMLSVNGVSVGTALCPEHICVWPHISLKPGANMVIASIATGQTDSVTWNGPDVEKQGLHIDAGNLSGHVSADGTRYGSDNFFNGGEARGLNIGHNFADRSKPKLLVTGAGDASLFEYYRQGIFSYDVPLPDGKWIVVIHSFEPDAAQSEARTFDISANGVKAITGFSPAKYAGGALKAANISFPVTVSGGNLKLDFTGIRGNAIVAAIDVVRAP